MARTKLLIDTNSYLRLAQNIHPLLCQPFGAAEYTLYMHPDLNREFQNSSRLRNKFDWASGAEYVQNRTRPPQISKAEYKEIEFTFDYMWNHVREEFHKKRGKGPSFVDTRIIATAAVLQIEVVTDDQDMIELAQCFDVAHLTSLEVMKRMLDANHITLEKIEMVVAQWQYDGDIPNRGWDKEYRALFGLNPPRE